jgi:Sulfotransferase family
MSASGMIGASGAIRGMAAGALFLTGMQRSGTTLLEKLLHGHPRLSVLSQPFPQLLVEVKRAFLAGRGLPDERYPLGPLFLERRYRPADLAEFLARHGLSAAGVAALFARMADDPAQYHRPDPARLAAVLPEIEGLPFAAAAARLWRGLSPKSDATWYGGKETLGEELVPALLAAGCRCLILLRDPRDVLASLNAGDGARHAGLPKPTLFNLRHWRKSVAVALAHEGHPGLRWLRFEDLVAHPHEVLDGLAEWLDVEPFGEVGGEVLDQGGRAWAGNSSHAPRQGIDAGSVGTHRRLLPRAVRELTEAVCGPEMACLGYETQPRRFRRAPVDVIHDFEDPFGSARPELAAWAADPARAEEEIRRLQELRAPTDALGFFRFPGVCERLRGVRGARGTVE